MQNALLGINAHINFDLPRAIAENLDPAELPDYKVMQKRKFDHDQVNDLLVRTVNPVQRGPRQELRAGHRRGRLRPGPVRRTGAPGCCAPTAEQVWWNALAFAAAPDEERGQQIVREKLERESYRLAGEVSNARTLWRAELAVNASSSRSAGWPTAGRRTPIERALLHDHRRDAVAASRSAK